jgi:hypothetical protein
MHVKDVLNKAIARITERGITRKQFAQELNQFLPNEKQALITPGYMVSVYRWLAVDKPTWVEPGPEVILAIQSWLTYQP